eukprot:1157596-Pelagomonas_calceolata.AAC.6
MPECTLSNPGMYCSSGTPMRAGWAATMPHVGNGVTATKRPSGGRLIPESPPPRPTRSIIYGKKKKGVLVNSGMQDTRLESAEAKCRMEEVVQDIDKRSSN